MNSIETNGKLVCYPTGRIDATNAAAFEEELTQAQAEHPGLALVLDAEGLDYISSAGLRVLLRQCQSEVELTVCNVSPTLYDIFDITGFTAMMKVEKAMRFVSVNGLEVLGSAGDVDLPSIFAHHLGERIDGDICLPREIKAFALLGVVVQLELELVETVLVVVDEVIEVEASRLALQGNDAFGSTLIDAKVLRRDVFAP